MTDQQPFFKALERLAENLRTNGLEEQTVAFLIGRLSARVSEQVMTDMIQAVGQEKIKTINESNAEEIIAQLKEEFEQKEGISLEDYREKKAEELVQEYESLGGEPGVSNPSDVSDESASGSTVPQS